MPGPPGTLSPPIWLWQQTRPSAHVPSTPDVQGQPTSVHGVGAGVGLVGSQPTDDGVQTPGAPGAAPASAQQTSVVSPHGFWVPVEQVQPTPGRDGSVQTGSAVAVGAAWVGAGVAVAAATVGV
jgi:hypothetical protein